MEALELNNRAFTQATIFMAVVAGLVIAAGMILFPLTTYDNPTASYLNLPALFNTREGNIVVFALFGILAANMAVFLSRVTRLEQERSAIQARAANNAAAAARALEGRSSDRLPPPR